MNRNRILRRLLERQGVPHGCRLKPGGDIAGDRDLGSLAIGDAAQARYGCLHLVFTRMSEGVLNLEAVHAREIDDPG